MSCTGLPQRSNIYNPTTRMQLTKLGLSSPDWLDPSTCRIMLYFRNGEIAGNNLRPVGGPSSLSSRTRILASGRVLDDKDKYTRVHELF